MAKGKFVAYYRVSTERQGRSGLGLDAQRKAVSDHLNGGPWELVQEFTEVESGKHADRPELIQALHLCQITGARLLIAKLDRLSRDAHFLLGLQKAGVAFVAADMPEANSMTVGVMALVAQHEREAISHRTKAALAAAKARGVKLGNPNGAAHLHGLGNDAAVDAIKAKAQAHAETLRPTIDGLRGQGITALRPMADMLNDRGILTPRNGRWHPASVARLLDRLGVSA